MKRKPSEEVSYVDVIVDLGKSLHRDVVRLTEARGRTLNTYMCETIRRKLNGEDAAEIGLSLTASTGTKVIVL